MDGEPQLKYRRILLKLSGEALMGSKSFGIDTDTINLVCQQIKQLNSAGLQVGIVVGGGNIFRGLEASERGMDRVVADNMGMLGTAINALAIMECLEGMGAYCRVMSAVNIESFAEPYIRRRAIRHMEKGRLVVFAAGTGNPYFTTDTAAALRASEISADVLIKGTKVDGVYSDDPEKNDKAEFYSKLSYMDVIQKQLGVMDLTAITMCKDNNMPVMVFNLRKEGNLVKLINGEDVGTLIS